MDARQALIVALSSAISAAAQGDEAGAYAIIRGLVKDVQGVLPGVHAPVVKQPADQVRREAAARLFRYWQAECGHERSRMTPERIACIMSRLRDGYTFAEITKGIDGAKHQPYISPDTGKRHDDITLICRNGSKLEDFIRRGEQATGVLEQVEEKGGIAEQIAATRRKMAGYKKEGRMVEYERAGADLKVLMAERDKGIK